MGVIWNSAFLINHSIKQGFGASIALITKPFWRLSFDEHGSMRNFQFVTVAAQVLSRFFTPEHSLFALAGRPCE